MYYKKKQYAIIILIVLMLGSSLLFLNTINPLNTHNPLNIIDLNASFTDFKPDPDPPYDNFTWDFDEGEIIGWKTETYINGSLMGVEEIYYNISDITYKNMSIQIVSESAKYYYLVQLALLEWNTSQNTFQEVEGAPLNNMSMINFTSNIMISSDTSPLFPFPVLPYFIPKNGASLAMEWCADALENAYSTYFSVSTYFYENWLTMDLTWLMMYDLSFLAKYTDRGILESGEYFVDMGSMGNQTTIYTKLSDLNPFNEIGDWAKDVGDVLYYGNHHGTTINKTRYEITKIENMSLYYGGVSYGGVSYAQVVKANVSVWNNSLQTYIQTEKDAIIGATSEYSPFEYGFFMNIQEPPPPPTNQTDPPHDFIWSMGGGNVPEEDEPDPMYDLKYLGYNATGNINLTVYGTLDATDGNMTAANPFYVSFSESKYMYQMGIGTLYDDDYDQIRAYISRIDFFTMEQGYWNGSNWVADVATMDSAGDNNWDLCESDPDGGSQIHINISDVTDIDIAQTGSWGASSMIYYPNQLNLAMDLLSITYGREPTISLNLSFFITPQGTTGDEILQEFHMGENPQMLTPFADINISSGRTWFKLTNTTTGGYISLEILPTGLIKDAQVVGEGLSLIFGEMTNITVFNRDYYNNFSIISGDFDTTINPSGTDYTVDLNITVDNPSLLLYNEMNINPTFSSLDNEEVFIDIMVNESDNFNSANITFSNPKYANEDVTIWRYNKTVNGGNGAWEEISYTDLGGGTIRISLDHLSIFALTGKGPTWVSEPEDQAVELGDPFNYYVNAEDPSDIDQYWLNSTTNLKINSSSGLITNNTVLSPGEYWLEISVNDTLGNINTIVIKITVESPSEPQPFIPIIPPAPPAQIPGYSVMISHSIAVITIIILLLLFKRKQKYLRNSTKF